MELFTMTQVKTAKGRLDLITQTPQLFLNPIENTLKDHSGSSITLLINGIAADSKELRNIPPDKIARVKYYEIPPVRYSFSGSACNVITNFHET